jgi:hypothetical protein
MTGVNSGIKGGHGEEIEVESQQEVILLILLLAIINMDCMLFMV